MKKTILWTALFTLLTAPVFAEEAPTPAPPTSTTPAPTTTSPANAVPNAAPPPEAQLPSAGQAPTTKQLEGPTTSGAPTQALPPVQPASPTSAADAPTVTAVAQPAANQAVNCEYKLPAATKVVDQALVLDWSEKATIQAFSLDPAALDAQFTKLQPCFTEQGWTGFNTALQQSGNLEAIKTQKLLVSSKVDGKAQMTESKINQWKVTMPLQVVYQNDKEKVSQSLTIDLTVNRKINGDLGITQIIATPRSGETAPKS